ncbi:hypothetical protein ACWKWP_05695 [Agromyces soli]
MQGRSKRRLMFVATVALTAAALMAGCSSGDANPPGTTAPPPGATTTPTATAGPSPAPAQAAAPAPGLTVVPIADGDCPVDPSAPGVVTFVVTADDDTTPIELSYSAFRPESDPVVRTTSAVGPVVVVMQSNCGNQTASTPWTFTATSATPGSLACDMYYGGKHVAAGTAYAEGSTEPSTVDCSGHPGM